jgi:hypothetical protein
MIHRVMYWESIADKLSEAAWSWGCVSAIESNRRTIWIAEAHRGHGKRIDGNHSALRKRTQARLRLFGIARVLVRFNCVTRIIVSANWIAM